MWKLVSCMCHMLRVSFESHKELVTQKKIFLFFILPILLSLFLSQILRLNKMNEELSERLFRAIQEGTRTIAMVSDSVPGHKHTSVSFCQWASPLSLQCLAANSVLHSGLHLRSDNSNSHMSLTWTSCAPLSLEHASSIPSSICTQMTVLLVLSLYGGGRGKRFEHMCQSQSAGESCVISAIVNNLLFQFLCV